MAHAANLKTVYFQSLLRRLLRDNPRLPQVDGWSEVLPPAEDRAFKQPIIDLFIGAILRHYGEDSLPHWVSVLLPLYLPRLLVIWRNRFHSDHDKERLWENIQDTFIHVVETADLSRRGRPMEAQLYWDTDNRIRTLYRRLHYREAVDRIGVSIESGAPGKDKHERQVQGTLFASRATEEIADRIDGERLLASLAKAAERGWITPAQRDLLIGIGIYGYTPREYARQTDDSYEAVRKRLQRTRKKFREMQGGLSQSRYPSAFPEQKGE